MSELLNLPAHINCKRCGECCGPVLATYEEIARIHEYIKGLPNDQRKLIYRQPRESIHCMFLDQQANKCLIYPVRPLICVMFGVVRGMNCKYGNSHAVDGLPYFMDMNIRSADVRWLNKVNWKHPLGRKRKPNVDTTNLPVNYVFDPDVSGIKIEHIVRVNNHE